MATYVASGRPEFYTGSITRAARKPRRPESRREAGEVRVRQGTPLAKLSRAEKIARDRRFGIAY